MEDQKEFLIALNAAKDLSRGTICRLAQDVDSWASQAATGRADAHKEQSLALGVPPAQLARARRGLRQRRKVVDLELAQAEKLGARIITLADAEYPQPLLDLELPPPVLYLKGEIPPQPAISIIGSRKATEYGRDAAAFFAHSLAEAEVCIVSGFARGIDAAAHRGALTTSSGHTIAVLGCGLGVLYPRGHSDLGEQIAQRGAFLSEFPCGRPPKPMNFPIRNRVIAALGSGTLVVQATPRSGSLITAHHALELGREVYAVPGRIFDDGACGPHDLIRDGATLVQHPREILEYLSPTRRLPLDLILPGQPSSRSLPKGIAGELLGLLPPGADRTPDDLTVASGVPIDQVLAELLELELAGWLRRRPGGAVRRILDLPKKTT